LRTLAAPCGRLREVADEAKAVAFDGPAFVTVIV